MFFCSKCANQLNDNQKFCPYCGTVVERVKKDGDVIDCEQIVESAPVKEPVVYTVFSIIGLIGGIVSIIFCSTFVYAIAAIFSGVESLVFSAIALKSKNHHGKAKAGFILSLLSIIFGIIFTAILVIVIVTGIINTEGFIA